MATFPTLRTGAAAQYPLDCSVRFQTQAVKFLDGSQQRYRLLGTGLRRWSLKLDLLSDPELAAIIAFVEQTGSGMFAFTDPITQAVVPKCVISADSFEAIAIGEMRAQTTLSIEEIL